MVYTQRTDRSKRELIDGVIYRVSITPLQPIYIMRRAFASVSLLVLFCTLALGSGAQQTGTRNTGVWDAVQSSKQRAGGASSKAASSLKRWRAHVENWGLDTSYHREAGVLGRLNSDGWSGGLFYGWKGNESGKKTFALLSFSEIKHEKQAQQKRDNIAFPELGPATPYVYGKVANLYTLNLGIGREMLLLPSVLEGNVSVGLRWSGGFSLATLKPYYLRLLYIDSGAATEQVQRYEDVNAEVFLTPSRILGAGPWKKGLNEMRFAPGLFGEAAVVIESGRQKSFVKTISLGASGALYTQQLLTLANRSSHRWETQLFVALQLGKRW